MWLVKRFEEAWNPLAYSKMYIQNRRKAKENWFTNFKDQAVWRNRKRLCYVMSWRFLFVWRDIRCVIPLNLSGKMQLIYGKLWSQQKKIFWRYYFNKESEFKLHENWLSTQQYTKNNFWERSEKFTIYCWLYVVHKLYTKFKFSRNTNTQLTFPCSKSTMKTLEKGMKYV